jgi:heptosyltransferase III
MTPGSGAGMIDWSGVRRVLVVKLRSIGDTVLATPSLIALRRFLPDARLDILLEDWVAPVLEGFADVDNVLSVGGGGLSRAGMMRRLRSAKYDVVFNLHGGTTSTFFTAATGARNRIGWAEYQYSFLYTDLFSSSANFWGRAATHSAEQQLALLGFAGVPVADAPRSRLDVTGHALASLDEKLQRATGSGLTDLGRYAILHPASLFATKEWPTDNFARVAAYLAAEGHQVIAVAAPAESAVLERLRAAAHVPVHTFSDLSLPQITALASRASIFVGNDSGIAHIAAAVGTPAVVVFGSSNRDHWRPWTDAPNEVVFEHFDCQPCAGYECVRFGTPKCILSVHPDRVISAASRLLRAASLRTEDHRPV